MEIYIFSLSFSLCWKKKNGHYAGIMLDAPTIVFSLTWPKSKLAHKTRKAKAARNNEA